MKKLNLKKSAWIWSTKKTDTKSEDSSTERKSSSQQFNQSELNDLVCDLDLSKQAAEILASRLNEKHVLHSSAKVSFYRKRDELFNSALF